MDNNLINGTDREDETLNDNSTIGSNAELSKTVDTDFVVGLLVIALVVFTIWFFFFRTPGKVTKEMLETIEGFTEIEIVHQMEDVDLVSMLQDYYNDIENVEIDVVIPSLVSDNPENYQIGDRYKVSDGYAYPIKVPLKMYITIQSESGEDEKSDPIDINVSGTVVYVDNTKQAFRDINIEYEDNFMDLINLSDVMRYLDSF